RAVNRLDEYWRRSGGRLKEANMDHRWDLVRGQLNEVNSWSGFVGKRLVLEPEEIIPAATRSALDELPGSVPVAGDRAALRYEVENGTAVVVLHLREGQARRLRPREIPPLDRPLR